VLQDNIKDGFFQKQEIRKGFSVKARYLIFLVAICIAVFLPPCHAGQAQEEARPCPKPLIKSIFPQIGKAGVLMIIQGEKFGAPPGEVVFTQKVITPLDLLDAAEVKAKIVSWTYHRIWVTVPEAASTGPVFVRVHCGAESNRVKFTIKK
jgi:hypothetical protein